MKYFLSMTLFIFSINSYGFNKSMDISSDFLSKMQIKEIILKNGLKLVPSQNGEYKVMINEEDADSVNLTPSEIDELIFSNLQTDHGVEAFSHSFGG